MNIKELINTEGFNEQDPREEKANSGAHGFCGVVAAVGGAILVGKVYVGGDWMSVVATAFYVVTLVELFVASAWYHSRPVGTQAEVAVKRRWQKVDHCSVFFLILGTYTPIAFCLVGGRMGLGIWLFNVLCTVIGVAANIRDLDRWHSWSLILYLVMGWSVVPALPRLVANLPVAAFVLVLLGGLFYTTGVILYILSGKKMAHFAWHICVAVGAALHYFFIYYYVI